MKCTLYCILCGSCHVHVDLWTSKKAANYPKTKKSACIAYRLVSQITSIEPQKTCLLKQIHASGRFNQFTGDFFAHVYLFVGDNLLSIKPNFVCWLHKLPLFNRIACAIEALRRKTNRLKETLFLILLIIPIKRKNFRNAVSRIIVSKPSSPKVQHSRQQSSNVPYFWRTLRSIPHCPCKKILAHPTRNKLNCISIWKLQRIIDPSILWNNFMTSGLVAKW